MIFFSHETDFICGTCFVLILICGTFFGLSFVQETGFTNNNQNETSSMKKNQFHEEKINVQVSRRERSIRNKFREKKTQQATSSMNKISTQQVP